MGLIQESDKTSLFWVLVSFTGVTTDMLFLFWKKFWQRSKALDQTNLQLGPILETSQQIEAQEIEVAY